MLEELVSQKGTIILVCVMHICLLCVSEYLACYKLSCSTYCVWFYRFYIPTVCGFTYLLCVSECQTLVLRGGAGGVWCCGETATGRCPAEDRLQSSGQLRTAHYQ